MDTNTKDRWSGQALVADRTFLTEGICSLELMAEQVAAPARPGQFINVYCRDRSRLLPRPISICEADPNGRLRLVFRVAGAGTRELAALEKGQTCSILGPLGNGFPIEAAQGRRVLLVGGGIGIPPLLFTANALCTQPGTGVQAVLGYRSGVRDEDLFLADAFETATGRELLLATEDGSRGTKGNVLDAMRGGNVQADVIFACGPMPMLRALKDYAADAHMQCFLSLEERMACGVGACLACVCHSAEKDPHFGVRRKRVCAEGPVFDAKDIVL